MDSGRLKYEKKSNYCPKVLVGNWFEDQCHYVKTIHKHDSLVQTDYVFHGFGTKDPNEIWDQRIRGNGLGARLLTDINGSQYLDNWSTTYDLVYNLFPKLSDGGPILRNFRFRFQIYEPSQDYCLNYGNIISTGISKKLRDKWRCDIEDPRVTVISSYKDAYQVLPLPPPRSNSARKKRVRNPITFENDKPEEQIRRCIPSRKKTTGH